VYATLPVEAGNEFSEEQMKLQEEFYSTQNAKVQKVQ
jgi:hypothetical protein